MMLYSLVGTNISEEFVTVWNSGFQTFFADSILKLCNVFAHTAFHRFFLYKFFCYDGYTIVVKTVTLRIVQSVWSKMHKRY
jgi:hypothetical protein